MASGAHQVTILKLLAEVGAGCERLLAESIKDVPVRDVQADEIWEYVRLQGRDEDAEEHPGPGGGVLLLLHRA
jgi:hypothetical protein